MRQSGAHRPAVAALRGAAARALHRPLTLALCALALLAGCAASEPRGDWRPRLGGEIAPADLPSAIELAHLELVSANLVSILVQLPEYAPGSTTLQASTPSTPFGMTLVRALEDAGYGLQRVSADQGVNYVGYQRRVSQTDAGEVLEYGLTLGPMSLSREYGVVGARVFPGSLLVIDGIELDKPPRVDDSAFSEQGGAAAFVSGIRTAGSAALPGSVRETVAADFDELPPEQRTGVADLVGEARRRAERARTDAQSLDLAGYERLRRTVLIFPPGETARMGAGNKEAVRLLVRDLAAADVFVITACTDADGRNEEAVERGLRVRDEFLSHGLTPESMRIAPCVRASFRHATDDSPVPVEVVQHRRRS